MYMTCRRSSIAANWEELYVGRTNVYDISPLALLGHLKILDISDTGVADLRPLKVIALSAHKCWLEGLDARANLQEDPGFKYLAIHGCLATRILPDLLPPPSDEVTFGEVFGLQTPRAGVIN